jgi:hypothetical protein
MSVTGYRPNPMNSVHNKFDGEEILKGSFNPDYIMGKQTISENYFRDKSLNKDDEDDDGYQPITITDENMKPEFMPK